MMDRMNHYNILQKKITSTLNDLKNLTSYEYYPMNKLVGCKLIFLCATMSRMNEIGWNEVTDLEKIILLIDLVTLQAIDLGKREDTLEMVLQVTICILYTIKN